MAGFRFSHRLSGAAPTIQSFVFKDTETLTRGDILNVESGQADLGATADTTLIGVALQTKAGTSGTSTIQAITDDDAVYEVVDNNAREIGATLDLTGATGAQGVTTSSNKEFIVVEKSTATQLTRVRVNATHHYKTKAN